jgi:precorrin-6B methylase 2
MEDRETSSRNFQRVTKYGGLDIVEGSAPSEAEKEDSH